MTRLAIRSLWARRVRAGATSLAVILGVAFIAGSYVLTDTIFAAFDEIFSETLKGTAVVITAENPVKQEGGEVPTIPDFGRMTAALGQSLTLDGRTHTVVGVMPREFAHPPGVSLR